MASNKLDVKVNVRVNGGEALSQLAEIKNTASNTGNSVKKDFSNISKSADKSGSGVKSAFDKGLNGVSEKVRGISESFSGLNGVMSSVMGTIGLGSFKSLTLDMAMTRDQAKNLLAVTMQGNSTFAEASQTAGAFIDKIKEGTSGSVVKLQMMIEAMNGIKLSTGMANSDLESLNDVIRKVGEASLLMGDDTEHATFVMKEAMSGLNGDFSVLKEQFGITKEKMLDAGWSGAADDVQGYRQALEQCLSGLGDMGQVMDTTSGKINKIKSNFSSAGLEIGNQMLPAVDWIATAFLDANENGNLLAKGILYAGGAASMFASLAPTLKPMFETFDSMKNAVDKARKAIDFLTDAEKIHETVTTTLDGLTAKLTGTKTTEAAATEAETLATDASTASTDAETLSKEGNAVASGESALASDGEALSKDAAALSSDAAALSEDADTLAKEANTVASGEAAVGNVTLAGALSATATSAWALTTALLANPLTWIVVAVIALVAVMWYLYDTNEEVRNSLNELGGLISGALSGAWDALSSDVTGFVNALVPAVLAIIDFAKWFVKLFTDFPAAQQQFREFVDNGINYLVDALVGIGGQILSAIIGIPVMLAQSFMQIVVVIQTWLNQARVVAGMLAWGLLQMLVSRWNMLVAQVRIIFTNIVNIIRLRLSMARTIAGALANAIRTAIVTRIQSVVARVRSFFTSIVSIIRSRLSNAVSTARQKALEIYNNIINKIREIPGQVGDEFGRLGDIIRNKLVQAAQNAMSGAAGIVRSFLSGLDRHSPGKIQRETLSEFSSLPGIVLNQGILATKATGNVARNITQAWSNNMETLSVPFDKIQDQIVNMESAVPTDFSVLQANMNTIIPNRQTLPQPNNNNTVNNDDHTIIYNIEQVKLDLNNLETDEKQKWWDMLTTISSGTV